MSLAEETYDDAYWIRQLFDDQIERLEVNGQRIQLVSRVTVMEFNAATARAMAARLKELADELG